MAGLKSIVTGREYTCALTAHGGVKCWGKNDFGQLGNGTVSGRGQLKPVDVIGLTNGATALAAGESHSCVVTAIGGAKCWGSNDFGQLGDGTTHFSLTPVDVIFSSSIYMPIALHNLCPDYLDDFSDPGSGWEAGEDEELSVEYLNDEYRVLIKPAGAIYGIAAPTSKRQDYVVEIDARWEGNSGVSYGLIFGIVGNYEQFYTFEVNTDSQDLRLYRYDASGWSPLGGKGSPLINYGTAINHLKVIRKGSAITLEINGSDQGTWFDGTISGYTGVGLIVSSYSDVPNADARFDNFTLSCAPKAGSSSGTGAPATPASNAPDLIPVNVGPDRLTAPAWFRRLPSQNSWR